VKVIDIFEATLIGDEKNQSHKSRMSYKQRKDIDNDMAQRGEDDRTKNVQDKRAKAHEKQNFKRAGVYKKGSKDEFKYNNILVVDAVDDKAADHEISVFKDLHWGAKDFGPVVKSKSPKGTRHTFYYFDKHQR